MPHTHPLVYVCSVLLAPRACNVANTNKINKGTNSVATSWHYTWPRTNCACSLPAGIIRNCIIVNSSYITPVVVHTQCYTYMHVCRHMHTCAHTVSTYVHLPCIHKTQSLSCSIHTAPSPSEGDGTLCD